MKKRTVISGKNLQMRSPIPIGLLIFLVMDRFNAPEWLWGIYSFLMLILIISWLVDLVKTESINIFENIKEDTNKSDFQKRLEELSKKK